MTREARDAMFDTSDGSAIAFTLHGAPRTGAPRLALIHSLALDRRIWDGVAATVGSDVELLTFSDTFRRDHPELVSRASGAFLANDFDCYAESCALLGGADLRDLSHAPARDGNRRGDLLASPGVRPWSAARRVPRQRAGHPGGVSDVCRRGGRRRAGGDAMLA